MKRTQRSVFLAGLLVLSLSACSTWGGWRNPFGGSGSAGAISSGPTTSGTEGAAPTGTDKQGASGAASNGQRP
jgi:hypothetical protein